MAEDTKKPEDTKKSEEKKPEKTEQQVQDEKTTKLVDDTVANLNKQLDGVYGVERRAVLDRILDGVVTLKPVAAGAKLRLVGTDIVQRAEQQMPYIPDAGSRNVQMQQDQVEKDEKKS